MGLLEKDLSPIIDDEPFFWSMEHVQRLSRSLLKENHYFINGGFFENEDQLIKNIDLVRSIPSVIVQGRYDIVCPMDTAWELYQAWPEAEFIVADNSGHSAFEKEITHHLVNATDKFASR